MTGAGLWGRARPGVERGKGGGEEPLRAEEPREPARAGPAQVRGGYARAAGAAAEAQRAAEHAQPATRTQARRFTRHVGRPCVRAATVTGVRARLPFIRTRTREPQPTARFTRATLWVCLQAHGKQVLRAPVELARRARQTRVGACTSVGRGVNKYWLATAWHVLLLALGACYARDKACRAFCSNSYKE